MNEIAYREHIKRAKEAEELYHMLRELYGKGMKNETLFIRARIDKLITDQEKRMLVEFRGR